MHVSAEAKDMADWPILDSGSENHISSKKPSGAVTVPVRVNILGITGGKVAATEQMDVSLRPNVLNSKPIALKQVLVSPEAVRPLVSVSKQADDGMVSVSFAEKTVVLQDTVALRKALSAFAELLVAPRVRGMYVIPPSPADVKNALTNQSRGRGRNRMSLLASTYTGTLDKGTILHRRMGHINMRQIADVFPGVQAKPKTFCDSCAEVKLNTPSFPKQARRRPSEPGVIMSYDDHPSRVGIQDPSMFITVSLQVS